MKNDSLGDRMKEYENAYRQYFPARLPVIIRIDGRAFHTFTRGFQRPFDSVFMTAMQRTALALCEQVAGCKFAYTQSDEISLLITNDDTINTQPWFGNNLQKLVSLSASIATLYFNRLFCESCFNWYMNQIKVAPNDQFVFSEETRKLDEAHQRSKDTATFDARAFILPESEVCNYFIWRQQDAMRNSVEMAARSLFSHKELDGVNNPAMQEMMLQRGVNWNDYSIPCKRGTCIIRHPTEINGVIRNKWTIDESIPVFHKNRSYVESSFIHKTED